MREPRSRERWARRQALGLAASNLLMLAALLGCPGRRGVTVDDPLPAILRSADLAWDARGEAGFEPVADALTVGTGVAPMSPEVQWRWVRYHVGVGLATPDRLEAVTAFAIGREMGLRCLDGEPAFSTLRNEAGWDEAVLAVGEARQPCVTWTAWAWIRWLAAFGGAAGAVDLAAIDPLVARAMAIDDPTAPALVPWMRGVLAAVRPRSLGRDLDLAAVQLDAAVSREPGELARRLDRAVLVALPRGDVELARGELRTIVDRPARTPEDRRVAEQAQSLIRRLPAAVADDEVGRDLLHRTGDVNIAPEAVLPEGTGEAVDELLPATPE